MPASVSERLIGAAAYCHLRLDLPNVDPVHARVASDTYGLSLADAGSTTGTTYMPLAPRVMIASATMSRVQA